MMRSLEVLACAALLGCSTRNQIGIEDAGTGAGGTAGTVGASMMGNGGASGGAGLASTGIAGNGGSGSGLAGGGVAGSAGQAVTGLGGGGVAGNMNINRIFTGDSNRIVEFPVIFALVASDITAGPDGRLWQTLLASPNWFGNVTMGGYASELPINETVTTSIGIVAGPDGNLWTTHGADSPSIRRIGLDGTVADYTIAGAVARYITVGPDGALWFTDGGRNAIGRITTDGATSAFSIPTAASDPLGITAGPDGALWFTETAANKIGRVAVDGTITEFTIPTVASAPKLIAAGPDGAIWFTESAANKIGRLGHGGAITEIDIPTPGSQPQGIISGPDGAIWFTESATDKIGRLDLSGSFTEFALDRRGSKPWGITAGPDGNIWFTEGNSDVKPSQPGRVGRLTPETKPFTRLQVPVNSPNLLCGSHSLQITNSGSTASGKLSIDLDPANPHRANYQIADHCNGVALDPGQSCTIDVAHSPSISAGGSITISVKPELGDLYEFVFGEAC